jgi:hypothetical protein
MFLPAFLVQKDKTIHQPPSFNSRTTLA